MSLRTHGKGVFWFIMFLNKALNLCATLLIKVVVEQYHKLCWTDIIVCHILF